MRFGDHKVKIHKDSIAKRAMIDPQFIEKVISSSKDVGEYLEIEQGVLFEIQREKIKNNSNLEKLESFLKSSLNWAKSGFIMADNKLIEYRKEICRSCDQWNAAALNNTGRCNKCGCSTWAKLRMATERCPLGKWEAVSVEDSKQ
jgi:hypothetical protein